MEIDIRRVFLDKRTSCMEYASGKVYNCVVYTARVRELQNECPE
jgi:hypothetical protein